MTTDLVLLEVEIGGKKLPYPIMNAAGTCRTIEEVTRLAQAEIGAIVVGSMTLLERPGHPGDTFALEDTYSVNSRGLPDPGESYWRRVLPEMVKIAHGEGKLLIVSVAGMAPDEFGTLTSIALEGGADEVEENFGCPNVWGDSGQKEILSYAPEARFNALEHIQRAAGSSAPITLKVSPYSNPRDIPIFATVIGMSLLVKAVVTMNTYPNARPLHPDGRTRIGPGFGGLAGPAVKPIGLGQVKMWRDALPEHIKVIGVGGVSNGQDMLDYIRTGAVAVQVATEYLRTERPQVFSRILAEYVDLLAA